MGRLLIFHTGKGLNESEIYFSVAKFFHIVERNSNKNLLIKTINTKIMNNRQGSINEWLLINFRYEVETASITRVVAAALTRRPAIPV